MPVYVLVSISSVIILLILAVAFSEVEKRAVVKLINRFCGLPVLEKCLVVGLLVAATAIGGSKNDSTNTPPLTGMFWFPQTSQQTAITASETNLGYRVVADDSAFGFAEPSQGAVTNEAWRLCGGVTSAFRLVPDTWYFPFRETGATGLTVIAQGEFRPDIATRFFPSVFDAPLAFLPLKNQSLLPEGVVSCFWHEQTASNSLILTWQNALYNRDLNCLTNFQAELFADGSFVYRYPDHTVSYAPVFPFDWDGDGLENSVDPEPLVAGPDAHGTNAEWYNTVCSNVFSAVDGMDGVVLSPRTEAVNTNAYYFVDVVAEHGPAPVYFMADRESDLGSPILIALSGVTNHVPLLIGLDYAVTSTVPFTVVSTNDLLELSCDPSSCQSRVKWPVSFPFESFGAGGYQVAVTPSWLGGVFSWTDGCCIASSSNAVAFTCSGQCSCLGCTAGGLYSYCGTALPFAGGNCGYNGQGAEHSGTNSVVPDLSVSLNLDHDVILFENAYTNRPGEIVSRQSTFTRVELTYGNSSASAAAVGFRVPQGKDRIVLHEDHTNGTIVTEWSTNVVAGTSGSKLFFAEGVSKSAVVCDVGLRAAISGAMGARVVNRALTTSQVSVVADALFPTNRIRHLFGPLETVSLKTDPPQDIQLSSNNLYNISAAVQTQGELLLTFTNAPGVAIFSLVADHKPGLMLTSQFRIIPPTEVVGKVPVEILEEEWIPLLDRHPLEVGEIGVGWKTETSLIPDYVSFEHIRVYEGDVDASDIWGCCTNTTFFPLTSISHVSTAIPLDEGGPGVEVASGNKIVSGDHVAFWVDNRFPLPCDPGGFTVQIPVWWHADGGEFLYRFGTCPQVMNLNSNGTARISKFGLSFERDVTGQVRIIEGGN